MPLDTFVKVAEGLRPSGFRPVRFRPYLHQDAVKVAAVWTRDASKWRIVKDCSPEEIDRQDQDNRRMRLIPVDVAGYLTNGDGGKPVVRYAAVWQEAAGDDARMYVGKAGDDEPRYREEFGLQDLTPRTLQVVHAPDGHPRISSVWGRPAAVGASAGSKHDLFESNFLAPPDETAGRGAAGCFGRGGEPAVVGPRPSSARTGASQEHPQDQSG